MSNVAHPEHHAMQSSGGPYTPAKPLRASWLLQRRVERTCRKSGGHWWHPDAATMIGWFCCQCGAERDGMPKDGE